MEIFFFYSFFKRKLSFQLEIDYFSIVTAKERPSHDPVSNKSPSQPMPAIIRKPIQSSASKSGDRDPTNDAVAAINKNKALTVTARSIAVPSTKVLPVTGVNNSITLSPIPNPSAKFTGSGLTIMNQTKINTTTQGRTLSPLSKSNSSSPIPMAITKVATNQTIAKSPTPLAKPNVLSSRNTNTTKTFVSVPKTSNAMSPVPTTTRVLNSNQSASPKILVQRTTAGFKPIVAQTKAQLQAAQSTNKTANNSIVQMTRVPVKSTQSTDRLSSIRPRIIGNRANTTITTIDTRKRPANEPIPGNQAKKLKPLNSNLIASVS